MSFFDLLNGLLSELEVPYYEGQPELGESSPPQFISYSVDDVPKLWGDGELSVTTYGVTVNIYTSGTGKYREAENISRELTALLTENGFIRRPGSFGLSNDFPRYYHRIIDFYYDYDLEE